MGDDKEDELARLKEQYNALERSAIEKECAVADDLRELREKRERERREKEKEGPEPHRGPGVAHPA